MVSEISNKASEMRAASLDEASRLLRAVAGSRDADESLKATFRRLSRKLPTWSPNRIADVWRQDVRVRVRAEEVEQLRELVGESGERRKTKDDLDELRQRIFRLEALLASTDSAFHSPQLDALRVARGKVG